jgi:DNA mismatch repair protein MLH3
VHCTLRSNAAISSLWQALEECVSNSLDAEADEVCVEIAAEEFAVTVADNGAGVPLADLHLLGTRSATSKRPCADGSSGALLGGRGEALAALCESAVVEVTSRARGCFETHAAVLRGGAVLKVGLAPDQRSCSGSVISVRDLLYNRPVVRAAILQGG